MISLIGWITIIELALVFVTWKATIWVMKRTANDNYQQAISLTCKAAADFGQHERIVGFREGHKEGFREGRKSLQRQIMNAFMAGMAAGQTLPPHVNPMGFGMMIVGELVTYGRHEQDANPFADGF